LCMVSLLVVVHNLDFVGAALFPIAES